ncbi:hypothetical protein DJ021_10435 [Phenylobacterium hankyongense]|uniref:Transporter n=1 Tax=Phenylobacterium hankyongense TaxID=1813876 RepID=A0A328B569_9CAUL|nr:hypothetical protein [Phenylobacterium hankyongense]RAK60188.1 hypothetical protein DJ021_10435 [Phenylobacterium hankyongense]
MRPGVLALAACCLVAAPVRAQPLARDELLEALKARDRVIAALEQRVAALEREHAATPTAVQGSAPSPTLIPSAASASAKPTPVDDDAELQALSRTLVQRGGLVLPPWRAEIIPTLAYSNREVQGLALAQTPEGVPTVADQRLREDQLRASAALRLGLPWSSQLEVRVPYAGLRESRTLGDGTHAVNEASGFGDVEVALSHQFLRESGWRPDLVGGLSWRFATGRDPFSAQVSSVAAGSGVEEFGARVTAVKSSDPMVFFATLSYAHDLAAHEAGSVVQPGDAMGLSLGAVLAVNPDTSLTFGLAQDFRARTQIDGVGAPGSDTTAASLQLGLDRVLGSGALLDVTLGVGLTRDAPDYALQVSLPIRFR